MKKCRGPVCKEINPDGTWKNEKDFYKSKAAKSGYADWCKDCSKLHARLKRNEDPYFDKKYWLKAKYNLSLMDYKNMEDMGGGVCAICWKLCKSGYNLAVDHDHDTGKVRGLLCSACNLHLGFLEENPEWIVRCNKYLFQY